MAKKLNRFILKLSGEYLAGNDGSGVDISVVRSLASELKECQKAGIQIGIVVGGGNFWRGTNTMEMVRANADYVGMLATAMNAIILQDIFKTCDVRAKLQLIIPMPTIGASYSREEAREELKAGKVLIFGGGTGSPYFSTDTGAVLRAIDVKADAVVKATHTVDGVYDKDPLKFKNAQKYDKLTFEEAANNRIGVVDETAMVLCKEHKIPLIVFKIGNKASSILKVALGEPVGTMIKD